VHAAPDDSTLVVERGLVESGEAGIVGRDPVRPGLDLLAGERRARLVEGGVDLESRFKRRAEAVE
jgi:hypothetical protein